MANLSSYIKIISAAPNYGEWDEYLHNTHPALTLKVTYRTFSQYANGPSFHHPETCTLNPNEKHLACCHDYGPVFETCDGIEIIKVEPILDKES